MQQLIGCSVSFRIAVGLQQGRKVFTLQALPAVEKDERYAQVAKESGFSLHAGVTAQAQGVKNTWYYLRSWRILA